MTILAILRAMLRVLLLLIGIVWATLLLISWGGPLDASPTVSSASQQESF